jgi:hypothetical protein
MARGKKAEKAQEEPEEVKSKEMDGMVKHIITQEDIDANPGMEEDLKVGDEVFLPKLGPVPDGFDADKEEDGESRESKVMKLEDIFQDKEEGGESRESKVMKLEDIFQDLESKLLHGSAEQMNAQQNELFNAQVKIKRLF